MRASTRLIALVATLLTAGACKQQHASTAAVLSGDSAATRLPCTIDPDSSADDLVTPSADDLAPCSSAALQSERDKLNDKIKTASTALDTNEVGQYRLEGKKPPSADDLPAIGDNQPDPQAPKTTPAAEPPVLGLKLSDSDELLRMQRESAELARQIKSLSDRQAAIDREMASRTGAGLIGGACVLTRDLQITTCKPNSADTDCKGFSDFNRAFYFRFGQCIDFPAGTDFADVFARTKGACVKLRGDFHVESCRDTNLDGCFDEPDDLKVFAFRSGKTCDAYRAGILFENLTPDSQRPLANTRFEADCRYAGSQLKSVRSGAYNTFACPCGANNDLNETSFYERGVESCKNLVARSSNVTPGTGGKFELDCKNASGTFRAAADGTFVCACGINNDLPQDTFYRNGYDSCRNAVRNGGSNGARFEGDCKLAGAVFKPSATNANIYVCACGKNNDLVEATFYQFGVESCRQKQALNPASNITPALKDQFRQRCAEGNGRAQDDAFADDGMSCACGNTVKLSLRVFARDVQFNATQDFVNACLREVKLSGNTTPDARSQVVRPAGSRAGTNAKCLCTVDTTGHFCGVSSNGAWLNITPYNASPFNCGNGAAGDYCLTGSLATTMQSEKCR